MLLLEFVVVLVLQL